MKPLLPRLLTGILAATLTLPLSAFAELPLVPDRTDWSAPAAAWWSHVQYLADDRLEGRRAGTPGYDKAVAYVEDQFRQAGLKPAGLNGYQQPVSLTPYQLNTEKSSAHIHRSTGQVQFVVGKQLAIAPDSRTDVTAPLVFIGYGLRIPRKHIDDYAGVDLSGKIAVFFNAPPERLQGPQRAYARGTDQRWKALRGTGAIGMLALALPRYIPGQETMTPEQIAKAQPQSAGGPRVTFADSRVSSLPGLQFSGSLTNADAGEKMFAGTGHTYADLLALAKAGKPLPFFPIPGTFTAHTDIERSAPVSASNVIGLLPGSDSKLKNEYVVVSAHLDHLGIGREINGDNLYNGAMDNASGIASLIECAKLLASQSHPKRSVLFIALTGEELGELGSEYFAKRPTVPEAQIVADLNMDMYLPLFPLRFLEVQGLGESTLGNDARAICQFNDVEVQFDKQPDENRFVRSDQVNFVKQGIPALAFKFGWTPDSPEEKTFNDWVKTRYHKPSDDLNQPVDKVAAAQFTLILAQLTTRVANEIPRPTWYPESSFNNLAAAR
ncbi:M28 family peptidase [Terriglobus sp.]|uniref:M28 family peptidase n=1 Tax=Terriglobus sp. TaxID=1889013 RepID=UPI003B00F7D5